MTTPNVPVFRIRTWADVRALLYFLTPLAFAYLVNQGTLDHDRADLWAALVLAVLSPVLAVVNVPTVDRWRAWVHGILGAFQSLVVGLHLFTDEQVSPVLAIVSVIAQSAIASLNVPNTGALIAHDQSGGK